MASPLRWFRRHQKGMLVVFGIGLMAAFGLGGVLTSFGGSGSVQGPAVNQVVAKWKGGEFRRSDLDHMTRMHFQGVRFLNGVREFAMEQKGIEFRPLANPLASVIPQGARFSQDYIDGEMIVRSLLAKKAENEGIVIGDGFIDDYIGMVAGNADFSRRDLERIHQNVNSVDGGMALFREHLKMELAAQQMTAFRSAGFPGTPNFTESVTLFDKTSNRIECEVIPVKVDGFIISETPTKSEARTLFDEGKYQFKDPTGKDPGFKINRKIQVQYMEANREAFLDNAKNKYNDEAIQAEYNRLVEAKDPSVMEVIPVEMPEIPDVTDAEDENGIDDESGTTEVPDTENNDEVPAPPGDPVENSGEDDETPVSSQDDLVPDENASDQDGAIGDDDQSSSKFNSNMSDVSLRIQHDVADSEQESTATESGSGVIQDEQGTESSELETGSELQESETENSATEDSETEDSTIEDSETGDQSGDGVLAPNQLEDMVQVPDDVQLPGFADEPEVEKRVKTLEECRDDIHRALAMPDVNLTIEQALDRAEAEVGQIRLTLLEWEREAESKRGPEPKLLGEIKQIAKDNELIFGETEMLTEEQLDNSTVGTIEFMQLTGNRTDPFKISSMSSLLFDQFRSIGPYEANRESDFRTQNHYAYWIIGKEETRIPEFAEAEPAITEFWRRQKSFEKAVEAANKIADSVRPGDKLSVLHPERTSPTGEFSWFNTSGGSPQISIQVGVENPDNEFMETAFGLAEGEAGTAANRTRDTVYVIQRTTAGRTLEESATDFMDNSLFRINQIPPDVQRVADWYNIESFRGWSTRFQEEMGLEFIGN